MPNNRLGCYYCFKTLNPEDDNDKLRSFVQCNNCNSKYHTVCWEKYLRCLHCNEDHAEPIQVEPPSSFSSTIRMGTIPIKVSTLVYIFGNKVIIVPNLVYKHFRLLAIGGLIGVTTITLFLFWAKPDANDAIETVSVPTATPSHRVASTSTAETEPSPTPYQVATSTPLVVNEKRFSRSEKRLINHCPSVNLRELPIAEASLITNLPCGTEVEVVGEAPSPKNPEYKWYHIRLEKNKEGWVYAGDDDTWLQPPLPIGIVTTKETRLNIRRGPETKYKVIGKAKKGEKLIILGKDGEWYHVQLQDGTKGYAHSDFIRVQD